MLIALVMAAATAADAEPPLANAEVAAEAPPVSTDPRLPLDRYVQPLDAGRYAVLREGLSAWSTSDDPLGGARALSHRAADGRVDGMRLGRVVEGGMMHALGLQNGDIVHAVAGHSLIDIRAAMEAYRAIQDLDEVTVVLTRRGTRLELVYEVADALPPESRSVGRGPHLPGARAPSIRDGAEGGGRSEPHNYTNQGLGAP